MDRALFQGRAPGLSSLTKSSKGCFGRTATRTARKEGTPGLSSIYIRGTKAWNASASRALGSGGVLSVATHSVPELPPCSTCPQPRGELSGHNQWAPLPLAPGGFGQ